MTTRSLLQLDEIDVDGRGAGVGSFFGARDAAPAYDAFAALDPLDDDYDSADDHHGNDRSGSVSDNGNDHHNNNVDARAARKSHNGQQYVDHTQAFEQGRNDRRLSGAARAVGQPQHAAHDAFALGGGTTAGVGDGDRLASRRERTAACFGVAPSARADGANVNSRASNMSDCTASADGQDENGLFGHCHHHHHQNHENHHQHHSRGHHHRHHQQHQHTPEPRHEALPFAAPFLAPSPRVAPCLSRGPTATDTMMGSAPDHASDLRDARRAYMEATEQLAERQRAYEIEREETIKKMDARHKLSVLPLHEAAAAAQDRMRAAAGALQRQFDRRIVELEADSALDHETRAAQIALVERARVAALHPDDAYGRRERAAATVAMNSTFGLMSMVDSLLGGGAGTDGVFVRGAGGPAPFVRIVPFQSVASPRHQPQQQAPSSQRRAPPSASAVRIEEID
ncbi:hypothetical protein pkur_cds_101 [Pandoravirus kuranda]|uniref:Uncharacterized protein n=1 Tax=Pandoravirus kuranda TaxID=3019033 RepID=A0AA95EML4_9VIRU|nr:hypothetical protein pkur_cds_101 [Pandoravirus kuranda]